MANEKNSPEQISREQIEAKLNELSGMVSDAVLEATKQEDAGTVLGALEKLRQGMLGKKGEMTAMLRLMGKLSADERPKMGALINQYREKIEAHIEQARHQFDEKQKAERLVSERIDVTMPGKSHAVGKLHPITQVYLQIRDIFVGMGFAVEEGPEIEWAKYNFDMLNFKPDHPARDTQDTFFIDDDTVLRTHTSPVQVRTMLKQRPPIRMICPGRVFRADDVDATHSPVFNQLEGLVVAEGITMGDLMGVLSVFVRELYGEETKIRFRPSHFPFTEPSTELDISCFACHGDGCRICKGTGWIEVLGCGMVHPNVLRMSGIDPEVYSGFAFGCGLDRIACLKYGIDDIRLLFENDIRFLEQF